MEVTSFQRPGGTAFDVNARLDLLVPFVPLEQFAALAWCRGDG